MSNEQKLREALQIAAKHLDMSAFELSYPEEADLIRAALSLPTQAEPAAQEAGGGLLRKFLDEAERAGVTHLPGAVELAQPAPASAGNHIPDAGKMVVAELPEPDGYLLQWPTPGGGREHVWRDTDATAKAIGCPHEAMYGEGKVREALSAQAVPDPWRDAVIEQLESWHIYVPAIHENSPRLAIKALVNIETQAALDPKVSSQAAALVAGAVPDERDKVDFWEWAEAHMIGCEDCGDIDSPERWRVSHSKGTDFGFTLKKAVEAARAAAKGK